MDNPQSTILKVEQLLNNKKCVITINKNEDKYVFIFPENRVYNIPAYQREIRWERANIRILINDVNNGAKFLGTVLLSTKDNLQFNIIDGQQRITTLIMIVYYLNLKLKIQSFSLCCYQNNTYIRFFDALEQDFCLEKINASEKGTKILKSDILEQRPILENLWDEIKTIIDGFSPAELRSFKDKLLASQLNILLNKEDDDTSSKQICVDYFLDLNDKSVKLDSIDILKARLFRIDYDLMTEKWADVQKK